MEIYQIKEKDPIIFLFMKTIKLVYISISQVKNMLQLLIIKLIKNINIKL